MACETWLLLLLSLAKLNCETRVSIVLRPALFIGSRPDGGDGVAGTTNCPPLMPAFGKYIRPRLRFAVGLAVMAEMAWYRPHCSKPKFVPGSFTFGTELGQVKLTLALFAAELSRISSRLGATPPGVP